MLTRGYGGLDLDVESNGVPQVVPVYVDGVSVGSTLFSGKVPLCSEVTVGEETREKVAVDLKWHEVVKYTHRLKGNPVAAPAPAMVAAASDDSLGGENISFSDNDFSWTSQESSAAKPFPASTPKPVASSGKKVSWGILGLSSALAVTGFVVAAVGNSKAKSAADKGFSSEGEYSKNLDDAKSGQKIRSIGLVVGVAGIVGIGLSFVF